jgi:hypothetical protein
MPILLPSVTILGSLLVTAVSHRFASVFQPFNARFLPFIFSLTEREIFEIARLYGENGALPTSLKSPRING